MYDLAALILDTPRKFEKEPKSEAGKHTVAIPPHILPLLREHADQFAGPRYFTVDRHGNQVRGNTI